MKLQNKKTGEIVENIWWDKEVDELCLDGNHLYFYNSLSELSEEWEDYEEPKEYFVITCDAKIITTAEEFTAIDECEEIGNCFETKEEAEKAVEKLKAWKRLKDKGFRFNGGDDACISYEVDIENWTMQNLTDFKTLFGGEE